MSFFGGPSAPVLGHQHVPHPAKVRVCAGTGDALSTAYRHLQTVVANPDVEMRKDIKDIANCTYHFTFDRPVITRFISFEIEDVHDFKVLNDRPLGCVNAVHWIGYAHNGNDKNKTSPKKVKQEEAESDVISSLIETYRPKIGKGGPTPALPGQTFTFRSPKIADLRVNVEGDDMEQRWSKMGKKYPLDASSKNKETTFLLRQSEIDEGRGVRFESIHPDFNMPSGLIL